MYCLRDADEAGLRYRNAVARSCLAHELKVKLIELPGVGDKQDVSDWLAVGHSAQELRKLIEKTAWATQADIDQNADVSDEPDEVPPVPIPELPRAGYIGIAKEFAELMSRLQEAPKEFFYFAFLTHLGAYISRRVVLDSSLAIEPRLYTVLLGDTGVKKSSALNEAEKFFAKDEQERRGYDPSEPEAEYTVIRNAGSGEGLAKAIREHTGGRALLEFDELRHLVEKVKIEGSSLLSILTTLYERNYWNNVTLRNTSIRLDGVGLSLLAASTFDNFTLMFGSRESDQGLLNRMWFVAARS